jgi:hypothetical protein
MAKAKLHNGLVLEFDDSLTDEQIDEAVAEYLSTIELKKLNQTLLSIQKTITENNVATMEVLKNTAESTVAAITAPRMTKLENDGDGKPAKSITTVMPTIFN